MIASGQGTRKARRKPTPDPRHTYHDPGGDVQTGGPRQLERAQTYRTSRPYYETYKDVWQGTPPVKENQAEFTKLYKARKKEPHGPKRKQLTAQMMLNFRDEDKLWQQGPDVLSNEAFTKYSGNLWKRARKFFPNPQDEPSVKFDYSQDMPENFYAWVNPGSDQNTVNVHPYVAREFMERNRLARGPAPSVLLHEWTHTRQPMEQLGDTSLIEGGADDMRAYIAKKLGIPLSGDYGISDNPQYQKYAAQVRKRGLPWILRGQFQGS